MYVVIWFRCYKQAFAFIYIYRGPDFFSTKNGGTVDGVAAAGYDNDYTLSAIRLQRGFPVNSNY